MTIEYCDRCGKELRSKKNKYSRVRLMKPMRRSRSADTRTDYTDYVFCHDYVKEFELFFCEAHVLGEFLENANEIEEEPSYAYGMIGEPSVSFDKKEENHESRT